MHNIWKKIQKGKEKNAYVLQNVKFLTFLEKRISVISLRYAARSLSNFCVLKVLYKCLIIQYESKHVAI